MEYINFFEIIIKLTVQKFFKCMNCYINAIVLLTVCWIMHDLQTVTINMQKLFPRDNAEMKCMLQLFICVSYLIATMISCTYHWNACNFLGIMHKLMREAASSIYELRNSVRNTTNRRYNRVGEYIHHISISRFR